ncbi:unnamed protein product [Prorocentrum cordatum]|uniref:Uncharacterized protein n=1 Tax=Prorocentrum cordatum TaxID=2364126 RepID=A0ABN9PJ43_9DINO|nr:unnamed protein product [Polarella glacialis]
MAMHARHCDRRLAVPLLLLWRVRARWHEEQEKLYFNVWFLWLFVLGTITVYGRLQANTFLGMVLYGFLTGNPAEATDHIWKETSTFHISLEAILLVMAFAQICHYAFGVLSYCPRWAKTAAHKRWQYGKNGGLGRWSPWGRSFEFEVKGIATADEHITDMSRWQQWMDGFEGATAMVTTSSASSANGKDVFITVPRGGPAKTGKGEYTPSDADFPISVQWTTNRHAYTTLFGEEMMHGASRASAAGQGVGGRHLRSWTLSRSAVAWVSCWRCSALSSTNTLRQLAISPSTKAKILTRRRCLASSSRLCERS